MPSNQDDFLTVIDQLNKLLPSTANKLRIKSRTDNEIKIGTILVSKEIPSPIDVIRFFQVIEKHNNKILIQELHQLVEFKNTTNKIGLCSPLIGLFINKPFEVETVNNITFLNGKKFAEKMPYDVIEISSGVEIKNYPMQIFTPLF